MSGTLPSWLEGVLGIDTEQGEGTAWNLTHSLHWPLWVIALVAAAAVVLVVWVYLREAPRTARKYRLMLAGVRLLLVAMVIAMIAQVSLSLHRTGLPYVVLLIDDSQSMKTADTYDDAVHKELLRALGQSQGDTIGRWSLVRSMLTREEGQLLRDLADDYRLRVYFLENSSRGLRPAAAETPDGLQAEIAAIETPEATATRLGDAVRTMLDDLRGAAPAAIILLTDGINTAGATLDDAAALASPRGVPLTVVGVGTDHGVRDLSLSNMRVAPVVRVDVTAIFSATLTGTGYGGREARVTLREKGRAAVLAEAAVTVAKDESPQEVTLPYRPDKLGALRFVIEVQPLEDELNTSNNRVEKPVEVRKQNVRVLLVQAYPNYESRFLQVMLDREVSIELHTVLQDADVGHHKQDPTALPVFPVSREELFAYDVILLADVDPRRLSGSNLRNLADFVDQPPNPDNDTANSAGQRRKGGALVLIAGPRYIPSAYRDTPLARLLPIQLGTVRYPDPSQSIPQGFVPRPTDLGMACPPFHLGDTLPETMRIWSSLPPMYWMVEAPELRQGVRVLAEHPTRRGPKGDPLPLIFMHYVGAGKVLFHATDETYRWRRRKGDLYFRNYWVQMIHYLCRSKLADDQAAVLSVDRDRYRLGDSVKLVLQIADDQQAPVDDKGVTVMVQHVGQRAARQ